MPCLARAAGSPVSRVLVVRALSRSATRGRLTLGPLEVPCALGRGGLTCRKREGDGATPVGRFALLQAFYRPDRGARPVTGLPLDPSTVADGWCDDPRDGRYNRPVRLPCAASHETLWRGDRLYDIAVVLDFNITPRVRGGGSAIFFHVARPGYTPTEGCVAVAPQHMRRLLALAGPRAVMRIV